VAYVGDVVGTGSSRKSAINSVLWHTGSDIPHVPNKRGGGVILNGHHDPARKRPDAAFGGADRSVKHHRFDALRGERRLRHGHKNRVGGAAKFFQQTVLPGRCDSTPHA
jgi:hypothetical protein